MKRRWKLMLCLLLVLATLSSCAGQPNPPMVFDEATQNLGPSATDTPTPPPAQDAQSGDGSNASIFSANPYDIPADDGFTPEDALGEENYIDPGLEGNGVNYVAPEGTVYPYAGSTPIPLDPVDAPTPTPRPELSFSYTPYTAAIGLTFEAPVGWLVDESVNEVFVLTEPVEQMKDNQQCVVTISAIPVTSNYTENNLKTEVTQRLSTISATNFAEWKPSLTATRYLMGSKGVYANYSGKLADGTEIGGRIHYTCIDKVLYGVEIVFPLGYKDDFLNVFSKVRESIKRN